MSGPDHPPPSDHALRDFLAARGPLHAAWRAASHEAPPPSVDAAVLAAARAATPAAAKPIASPAPPVANTRDARRRWRGPVSLAASLVLGSGLVWQVQRNPATPAENRAESVAHPVPDSRADAAVAASLETSLAAPQAAAAPAASYAESVPSPPVAAALPEPTPAAGEAVAARRDPPAVEARRSPSPETAVAPPPPPAAPPAAMAAEALAFDAAPPPRVRQATAPAAKAAGAEQKMMRTLAAAPAAEAAGLPLVAGEYRRADGRRLHLRIPDDGPGVPLPLRVQVSWQAAPLQDPLHWQGERQSADDPVATGRAEWHGALAATPGCELRLAPHPEGVQLRAESCPGDIAGLAGVYRAAGDGESTRD